jgi:isopropanol dehydrogenase (NADP+)
VIDPTKPDALSKIVDLSGGRGVDSAIEALGANITFENAVKVTKAGGTISNIGYHGTGEYVPIPRVEWGVGMAEKTIKTSLCPGGSLRLRRLLRLLENKKVDPTKLTTHTFKFDEADKAFETMDKKLDGVIKPLVRF